MSSLAHVDNGGLWRGNRRIIVGYEALVGAVFRRLWWLHRILRLKGFVIFVVRDDVRHKYVCLPGFRLFNGSAEGAKGMCTGSRSGQAHVGGWVQRYGLRDPSLGPEKHYIFACC